MGEGLFPFVFVMEMQRSYVFKQRKCTYFWLACTVHGKHEILPIKDRLFGPVFTLDKTRYFETRTRRLNRKFVIKTGARNLLLKGGIPYSPLCTQNQSNCKSNDQSLHVHVIAHALLQKTEPKSYAEISEITRGSRNQEWTQNLDF